MGPEKKKPDHDYKVDTKIGMSLSIGFQGKHEDTISIGELLSLDQDNLDSMSKDEIEDEINEAVTDWTHNYIDYGWSEE